VGLLGRMARTGRGSDGKQFDYAVQCKAQAGVDEETLRQMQKDIEQRSRMAQAKRACSIEQEEEN